jgi:hypothetical protein
LIAYVTTNNIDYSKYGKYSDIAYKLDKLELEILITQQKIRDYNQNIPENKDMNKGFVLLNNNKL